MRITFRRILNLLLYLSFCVMVGTGLLMAYRLIPGSRGGQGLEVLGWNRHEWGALHTWVSYVFITLVAAHLAINWTWLTKVAAKGHAWHLGAGLLAGGLIIGTFLLLPTTKRQGETGKKRGITFLVSPGSEFIRVSSASNESVSFQKDIYPILETSCLSCHGPENQKAGFRADERSDFFRDDGKGPLVLPGNSGEEPPGGHCFRCDKDEAQRVRSRSFGAGGRTNQVVDPRGRPIACVNENPPATFCESGNRRIFGIRGRNTPAQRSPLLFFPISSSHQSPSLP